MTFVCRRLFAVPLLVFALGTLGTTSPCGAASGRAQSLPYANRTDTFRRLLFELRFQPVESFTELEEKPSESLFIMLGDPKCLASKGYLSQGLRSFVVRGGAVLIATDMKTEDEAGEELRKLAGVTVAGDLLSCAGPDPAKLYEGSPYCPFVQPIADRSGLAESRNTLATLAALVRRGSRPPLFRIPYPMQRDLRIAANAPSYLQETKPRAKKWSFLPGGIHRLACLPGSCATAAHYDGFSDSSLPNEVLFAVGGMVGKGRVLVLADHSIFINCMILPRDNDNLEFAINCLHWLRGGVSTPAEALRNINTPERLVGQRNKVLFWDDGIVRKNFEVPLRKVSLSPVIPPEPVIVAAFDKTLANLEARDAFNLALLQHIDDLPDGWPRVVRNAVYMLTLAVALFLAYRFLWRSRHRPEFASLSLEKALRDHEPKASLLDQRRRAQLRLGNVWEMGHRLARECFESAGVPPMGASAPRVRMMQGSRWQRWREQRRVARLWRLARGGAATHISPVALQHLLREVEQLKTALADGTITLG